MAETSAELPPTTVETLQLFHHEELVGEALFATLLARETDPQQRIKLAYLTQVETENVAWMRDQLSALNQPATDPAPATEIADQIARTSYARPWPVAVRGMHERLQTVHIPRFQALLDQAKRRGDPIEIAACRLMLTHEFALAAFAECELARKPLAEVVQPLRAILRNPPDITPTEAGAAGTAS